VISTRAREIARSALNFSDLELDEFFSDIEVSQGILQASEQSIIHWFGVPVYD